MEDSKKEDKSQVIIDETDNNSDSDNRRENTRSYIAQLYVWGFFIAISLVYLLGYLKNFSVQDFKDMIVTLSGILSGPLGFIVGYYFKASKE